MTNTHTFRFLLACLIGGLLMLYTVSGKAAEEETVAVPKRLLIEMVKRNEELLIENAEYEDLLEKAVKHIERLQKATNCV